MSPPPADGTAAALVAAAVQAAIREGAPRRTVAAVAAAVANTAMSAAAQPTRRATMPRVPAQEAPVSSEADDPELLLASLRAARRAQRQRKKQRRREAKQAANAPLPVDNTQQAIAGTHDNADTAGQSAEQLGVPAAVPAPVPDSPVVAMSEQRMGLKLQRQPKRSSMSVSLAELGIDAQSEISASVASSGVQKKGRTAAVQSGYKGKPGGQ